ncbi:MAG TPA: pyridoxamine 5'-phosphate oxidase family protein [Alphaproteobacteria bacterium]|nr:pyridoxamine 5'-phosphate oxidase family protein [Alphaproteobacteria bacterium]
MPDHLVTSIDQLEAIYGKALERSLLKEVPALTPEYRPFIEHAPFMVLATAGPEGLDCSPRGDAPGFVRIIDDRTLALPDRRGNNRIDSLRNVVRDPRVALLFMVPGVGETLRVNGRAAISVEPALLDSFIVDRKAPRSVLIVAIESVYFQCTKALVRSHLWDASRHVDRKRLPSAGDILAALSKGDFDGATYDRGYPEHMKTTLY